MNWSTIPHAFSYSLHYFSFSPSFISLSCISSLSPTGSSATFLISYSIPFGFRPPLPYLYLHQSLITSLAIHSLPPPHFLSSCLFLLKISFGIATLLCTYPIWLHFLRVFMCISVYQSIYLCIFLCILSMSVYLGTFLCILALRRTNLEYFSVVFSIQ